MLDKVKIAITREDGIPIFSQGESAQVEHLTEAAPVLVVVLDGGTVRTMQGDQQSAVDFMRWISLRA